MMLLSRVNRLEQRHTSGNPLAALTDDELNAAIEALNQNLADVLGVSSAQTVDISVDLDEHQVRALVARIKSENANA